MTGTNRLLAKCAEPFDQEVMRVEGQDQSRVRHVRDQLESDCHLSYLLACFSSSLLLPNQLNSLRVFHLEHHFDAAIQDTFLDPL